MSCASLFYSFVHSLLSVYLASLLRGAPNSIAVNYIRLLFVTLDYKKICMARFEVQFRTVLLKVSNHLLINQNSISKVPLICFCNRLPQTAQTADSNRRQKLQERALATEFPRPGCKLTQKMTQQDADIARRTLLRCLQL